MSSLLGSPFACVLSELDIPVNGLGIPPQVQIDVGRIGDDGIGEQRIAKAKPAVFDSDNEPDRRMLGDDRPESLIQVDSAVGKPLDVEVAVARW